MEIILNKTELAGALPALGKLISRTSPLEESRAVEIEGLADHLYFRTRNGFEEIEFMLYADMEDGIPATLIEFDQFRLAVRNCRNKTLKLEYDCGEIFVDDVMMPKVNGDFPPRERIRNQGISVTELPDYTLSALAALAPITQKDKNARRILTGINVSEDGFTAANDKELMNIPLPLGTHGNVTIPFPLTLLATKAFDTTGRLIAWKEEEETCFELKLGKWTWRGTALRGDYPNWKQVVPERTEATHYVFLQDESIEQVKHYLKGIPDEKDKITKVKLSRLPEAPGHLHLESSNGLLVSIVAEFDANWGDLSVTVRKDLLLHLLDAGNRKIELNDAYGPIVGTYGFGMYVAMPIRPEKPQVKPEQKPEQSASTQTEQVAVQAEQPTPASTEQKITTNTNTTPSTKENITMIDTNTIPAAASANTQTSTLNNELENAPSLLDDLTASIEELKSKLVMLSDESVTISRKLRKFAIAQRQKDREYRQAKRALNRVHVVSAA